MKKKKVSGAAPVQVYLGPRDRDRLERLASRLDLSKSDVLRRGIEALERQVTDPDFHPDRKSTRLNSSHSRASRMPSSA